jgi:thiamine transporter ThiT
MIISIDGYIHNYNFNVFFYFLTHNIKGNYNDFYFSFLFTGELYTIYRVLNTSYIIWASLINLVVYLTIKSHKSQFFNYKNFTFMFDL